MADIIKLLPYNVEMKGDGVYRTITKLSGRVDNIYREYITILYKFDKSVILPNEINPDTQDATKYKMTYPNPILKLYNGETAKILQFRRK